MGKAKIQSHVGDGLYFVTYYRDVAYAEKELKRLEKLRKEIESAIYKPGGLNDQLVDLGLVIQEKGVAFDEALAAWKECASQMPPCPDQKTLMATVLKTSKEKSQAISNYMKTQTVIATYKADALAALRRMAFFQSYGTDKAAEGMNVWCVDFPHESTGPIASGTIVGTIETYGGRSIAGKEFQGPSPAINIQVSYGGNAPYNNGRDHKVQPLAAESVATGLVNSIEWLGVMAKRPEYETGTLTNKNDTNNTGTVVLYGNTLVSGAPSVADIFPKTLTNIPIVYQDCHAKVFEVGDRVIVKYGGHLRDNPTVIGFASNPRECKWLTLAYSYEQGLYIVGDQSQSVMKGKDGTPVKVYPTTDTYSFIGWNDYNYTNPRQDMNVQASLAVIAKSMPTPIWPDSIDFWVSDTGVVSFGSCCYGGSETPDGSGGYTRTFSGTEDRTPFPSEVNAAKDGWYVSNWNSYQGGNPGTGSFDYIAADSPAVVGHVLLSADASGYEIGDYNAPAPSTCVVKVARGVCRNGGAGYIISTDAVITRTQTGSSCTGTQVVTTYTTWMSMLAGEPLTPPPTAVFRWNGSHNGMAVTLKRYYTYSHIDTTTGKAVFVKGGQVVPP